LLPGEPGHGGAGSKYASVSHGGAHHFHPFRESYLLPACPSRASTNN